MANNIIYVLGIFVNGNYYFKTRMKSLIKFILSAIFVFIIHNTYSQYVQIGSGLQYNESYDFPTPYGTYYKNHRVQYLYLANELSAVGLISGNIVSLGFNVADLNLCSYMPNYNIKMKLTSLNEFSETFESSGLSNVWSNSNYLPVLGWNYHTLDMPFYWDGISNIIIDICFDMIPGDWTENASVYYSHSENKAIQFNSDYDPACNEMYGDVYSERANLRIIGEIASCMPPSNLYASNIGNTYSQLNWLPGGDEIEWDIEWGESGFAPGSGTLMQGLIEPNYYLDNLTPNTAYDFYVRSVCDELDLSSWAIKAVFTTACDEIAVPYQENFDLLEDFPDCWTFTSDNSWSYAGISDYFFMTAPNSLVIESFNGQTMFSLPIFNQDINELMLSFAVRNFNSDFDLIIGTNSNPQNFSTFNPTQTINFNSASWTQHTIYFINNPSTDNFISILYDTEYSSENLYFDDFYVDVIPNCPQPFNLSIFNIQTESAELSFSDLGSGIEWEIEYGPLGFNHGEGILLQNINSNSILLESLSPQTHYEVYIKAICAMDEESSWSSPYSFLTACGSFNIPIYENFDSSDQLPLCWNSIAQGWSSVFINLWNHYSPPYAISLDYWEDHPVYLVLPEINDNIETLRLKFKSIAEWGITNLSIGTMQNPLETETYVEFVNIHLQNSWEDYSIIFSDYTGSAKYIAFKLGHNYLEMGTITIDDIILEIIPDCLEPMALNVHDINQNSAIASWTDFANTNEWDIEYGLTGFTIGDGTISTGVSNPHTITDLSPASTYDFYVRAKCGENNYSYWSGPKAFTTECAALSLPIIEDFDSSDEIPLCWITAEYYEWSISISMYYMNSSSPNSINLNTNFDIVKLSLPEIDQNINKTILSFNAAYDSGLDQLQIGTSSNPHDMYDFTLIKTIDLNYYFEDFVISLTNYTGTDKYVSIRYGTGLDWGSAYVDDFQLVKAPSIAGIDINNDVADIISCTGLSEAEVSLLFTQTIIINDENGSEYHVNLSWNIQSFDSNTPGTYNAVGTFSLPDGVIQTDPEILLNVTAEVVLIASPIVDCPEDFTVTNPNAIILENALPEGGIYTINGIPASTFYPIDAGNGVHTITYTYTDTDTDCYSQCDFLITVDIDVKTNFEIITGAWLYPNPSTGMFTIENEKSLKVSVSDISGRIILTKIIDSGINEFNLSDQAKGIYFVILESNEKSEVIKLILE